MPKFTIDESLVTDANLKKFAKDGKIEIWTNTDQDAVAGELNPALEANKNKILKEKQDLASANQTLLESNNNLSTEVMTLRTTVATNKTVSPEDFQIIEQVKTFGDASKAIEMLKNGQAAIEELNTLKTKDSLRSVASAMNWNEDAFNDLATTTFAQKGLSFATTEKDGKTIATVSYKKGENQETKDLSEFVTENETIKTFLPSLAKQGTDGKGWLSQFGSGSKKESNDKDTNPTVAFVEKQNQRGKTGNPLGAKPFQAAE